MTAVCTKGTTMAVMCRKYTTMIKMCTVVYYDYPECTRVTSIIERYRWGTTKITASTKVL